MWHPSDAWQGKFSSHVIFGYLFLAATDLRCSGQKAVAPTQSLFLESMNKLSLLSERPSTIAFGSNKPVM
jgi:hypothetical protein